MRSGCAPQEADAAASYDERGHALPHDVVTSVEAELHEVDVAGAHREIAAERTGAAQGRIIPSERLDVHLRLERGSEDDD